MSRFRFSLFPAIPLAALIVATPLRPCAAQQSGATTPPAGSPQGQTSQQPNSDYGSGGHAVMQNDMSGAELQGTVYDSAGTLRYDETNTFTTAGGVEHKTEQHAYDYDFKGHLQLGLDYKYDLRDGLSYTDITHYGLHGERTAEEVTNYRADGYEIKDWSLGTHQWYSNLTSYKTPLPTGSAAQTPLTPTNTNVGVLLPRSYAAGETITGSLWPSNYAENFKTVPGLTEYSFPIQLYHLPDGSPEWSSLQIGVKGNGYFPVNPNGTFSLHIPYDWKGSLQLQARQPDPVAGLGPTDAQLNFDSPIVAPGIPDDLFPSIGLDRFNFYSKDHLVDLWQDACDDEELLDELYDDPNPDWARIYAIEDRLDDTYDDIDEIEDDMSPQEVVSLAQSMYQEAIAFQNWLGGQPNLSADDKDDLADSKSWSNFLEDEIGYNKFLSGWGPTNPFMQPFFSNSVLTQGKLGVIGGSFPIDPYDTFVHIDKFPITPLASTPYSWYFMPPGGLTAGLHNYIIDSPLYPETIFPVFSMTLYMYADNLNLLKGQSTMYHVILSGLNGLPGGAWGGSSDPTDLVGSSELSVAQKAVGTSRTGYITLSITNGSPGVISMQDQFLTYNSASFVPNGSHETDGGVTALVKGSFIINGLARAYLNPEIGVGIPPGSTSLGGSTDYLPGTFGKNWLPSFSLNYDPVAFKTSSFMNMSYCPDSGAASAATTPTATGATPATPCVESVINDLMPVRSVLDDTPAKGNVPQTNEVQDNTNRPDLKQLSEAARRVDDARKKENAAFKAAETTREASNNAYRDGVKDVPEELMDKAFKAQDNLFKAEATERKMKMQYAEKPTDDNAFFVADAQQDVAAAQGALRVAEDNVIDAFTPAKRTAYDAAKAADEKAQAEYEGAKNELREANEALNKLQAATAK